MRADQAKKISMFDLLAHLGHHPKRARKGGNDVWYISPFRQENDTSFKIRLSDNIWYDHGEGKGGNILDFVMKYKQIDLRGALSFLEKISLGKETSKTSLFPIANSTPIFFNKPVRKASELIPKILEIKPVFSYALKNYIKERAIEPDIAYKYLKEIQYHVDGKQFYALGFKNRAGGWELRSPIFKGCIGEKDITVIETGQQRTSIFEGYMDFLSYLTLKGNDSISSDILILNSNAMKRVGLEYIKKNHYKEVCTFLDNDPSGQTALEFFKAELRSHSFITCNYLYASFNDLNDYLMQKTKNSSGLNSK